MSRFFSLNDFYETVTLNSFQGLKLQGLDSETPEASGQNEKARGILLEFYFNPSPFTFSPSPFTRLSLRSLTSSS